MFGRLFGSSVNVEKELVFLKFMYALAHSDGISDVEKDFIGQYMMKGGKSKALKIIEEARRQETQNHDMERFMVDAKALTRSEQNELLNELVSLSKVDHKITNEEATFIMIAAEALSFDINGVMSTLTQNGLDLNSYQSYVNTNFNTNSSSSNNTDNEVGFLAAKRRYEQENQQQTKFCPECGTAFSAGSFCGNCGTSL